MKILLIAFLFWGSAVSQRTYCSVGESCYPTEADIQQLYDDLGGYNIDRVLFWPGGTNPPVSAVPIGFPDAPNFQPLYGLGANLSAVYSRQESDLQNTCFISPNGTGVYTSEFCLASIRNGPYEGWTPSVVVWPTNVTQVQTALKFALDHNLCVSIAGTGHDLLNRHSCKDGVFIRMSLFKDISWDLSDERGFGNPDGNVKVGAGRVWSEVHESAAANGRVIISGWATTVGVVGWTLGGGHGPLSPGYGLGVDNLLEADIILANGTFITANSNENSDLYWALRGGGGSNWGIITAITIKAYRIPAGGITTWTPVWTGNFCNKNLYRLVDTYSEWSLNLTSRLGGYAFFAPTYTGNASDCNGTWSLMMQYFFTGPPTDPEFTAAIQNMTRKIKPDDSPIENYANMWLIVQAKALENIIPTPGVFSPNEIYPGGIPSVLVSRKVVLSGLLRRSVKNRLASCLDQSIPFGCSTVQLFTDFTGTIGSPQNPNVSISSSFRTALIHYQVIPSSVDQTESLYALGNHSYFAESAYNLVDPASRYWGAKYRRLSAIKTKYDPTQVFTCHNCVNVTSEFRRNCSKQSQQKQRN